MRTTITNKTQSKKSLGWIISFMIVIAVGFWGYWGVSETLFADKLVSAGRITALLTGVDPDMSVTQEDIAMIGLTGGGQGRGSGQGAGRGRFSARAAQESDAHAESGLSRHSIASDWPMRLFAYAGVFFGIALIVYLVIMVIPKWLQRLSMRSSP